MAKKTATRTRPTIRASRKVPHRPLAETVAQPPKQAMSDTATPTPDAVPQEWQTISVPAPPGIYAGVDYDGNGVIFRRVDTHFGINQVTTHLESLAGERIAASSIAQYIGPLPEFGNNPQFGMFVNITVPVTNKG